ncbi:15 kDa lipoprotein [Treponema primitia ZAS-2]|uniref:15 kDa lipoprotein n=1 Tax=Treponema primitia (strain ATCC BAA-887 / DSM 12427 / ZAS-2) TaxID=545694 RepID=F5YQ44_TREPZ|nr:FMN-binding protein [Treponema primitia]AEF85871.1 15 kDa lipoprotein [Treponema primitia ZAS-2]
MKKIFFIIVLCGAALLFFSCSKTAYKDGTYRGKSALDDTGAWGEIALTLRDGKVTDCVFITHQKDGSIKDENYGKVNGEISNQDFYDKAQLAVRAMAQYQRQYMETQSLKNLDAVSGATIAYNQFIEATELALEAASK